jgi:hypothetical protein
MTETEAFEANKPILLGAEPIRVNGDRPVSGTATVSLRLLPSPKLVVEGRIAENFFQAFDRFMGGESLSLEFSRHNISADFTITTWRGGEESEFTATLRHGPIIVGAAGDSIRVEFLLANFPDFFAHVSDEDGEHLYNEVRINGGGWTVYLRPVENVADNLKAIRAQGGFGVTHLGKLERIDGSVFSSDQAMELITSLHYLFSFARGFWCSPLLPSGYDADGNRVWMEWGVRTSSAWRGVHSWFDPHRANVLAEILPGFLERWGSPLWRAPLARAIHWYLSSNTDAGGIEGSIILTQTALELLAWTYLVQDTRAISKKQFKNLPASGQIRLLLTTLGIPAMLPSELTALKPVSESYGWEDGPHAFSGLRNSIVHPRDNDRVSAVSVQARLEALQLGLWYMELTLLRLFGHTGEYGNRLVFGRWAGQVELVPWAIGASDASGSVVAPGSPR